MGVDADCLLGYGIFLDSVAITEDYGHGFVFKYEDENRIIYNYNEPFDADIVIVTEPYSTAWTFVGVDFLG